MSGNERSGPFEKQYEDEDLVSYIEENEVVTTREVADHFDYHLQTVRRRLKTLQQEGRIRGKDVGKRLVWWVSDTDQE